ncbi:MAG TPA: branched-chain amino acid ABC transporter permease [Xanthobacteraceae bacterium]|jgi:branched-chain amino acid transport system permease protein
MEHLLYLGTLAAVWVIAALAANLVIGYTGMMAMGQAAYLGVGAYVAASLNILLGINFYVALVAAIIAGALAAAVTLLPLLRIGGFYFALATLGVNFVFFDIFNNLAPRVEGSEGLYGLDLPALFSSSAARFASTVMIAVLCLLFCRRVVASPLGRALRATRDRPDALAALGKDPRRYQMIVWTLAGGLTALAGALYAATLFYIDPTLFTLDASILILVYIGVGGLASLSGSVLGVLLLIAFNESLRFLGLPSQYVGPLQQAMYGLLLIGLMIFRRRGLLGEYDFRE